MNAQPEQAEWTRAGNSYEHHMLEIIRGLDERRQAALWDVAEAFWRAQHDRPKPPSG